MSAELYCYDYVNQPYEIVRRNVLADPQAIFARATSGGKLHVTIGGLDLGTEVDLDLTGVTESHEQRPRPVTILGLAWRSRHHAKWFPVMTARLSIYPLTATETQLELAGTYVPPLGVVGEAIDGVAMKKVANESVETFIREVARYLRHALATAQTA